MELKFFYSSLSAQKGKWNLNSFIQALVHKKEVVWDKNEQAMLHQEANS